MTVAGQSPITPRVGTSAEPACGDAPEKKKTPRERDSVDGRKQKLPSFRSLFLHSMSDHKWLESAVERWLALDRVRLVYILFCVHLG
jgi:hypothetical protein